jgi:hypothetical protein
LERCAAKSALGQKQTFAVQQRMSPPIATEKADMPQMVMSALPLEADVCGANRYVYYRPIADIGLRSEIPVWTAETQFCPFREITSESTQC